MKMLLLTVFTILTTSVGKVEIPLETIRSITYDKVAGTEMYVNTTNGTQTFAVSDVVSMSVGNAPEPSSLESLTPQEAKDAYKVLVNGVVYVVRDGKWFTIKGEEKR